MITSLTYCEAQNHLAMHTTVKQQPLNKAGLLVIQSIIKTNAGGCPVIKLINTNAGATCVQKEG